MYHNQLIERTIEKKPANEYLHSGDDLAWLSCLPGRLGNCSWTSAARSEAFICFAHGCRCPDVFSLRLLVSPQLWYSKKEQPLKGDNQALVVMSLSECT